MFFRKLKADEKDADVAFMLDCTYSMDDHIFAAKENIKEIVREITDR